MAPIQNFYLISLMPHKNQLLALKYILINYDIILHFQDITI